MHTTNNNENEGEILIDDSKKGIYKINFIDKLRMTLIAKDNFKFTIIKERPLNTIAVEGIDANAIIDCIKLLKILY